MVGQVKFLLDTFRQPVARKKPQIIKSKYFVIKPGSINEIGPGFFFSKK